jgi:lysophospholipase L1-like esterase
MRRFINVVLAAAVTLTAVTVPQVSSVADADTATHYCLALGDSIAAGDQFFVPGQPFYSPTGYVALVHTTLAANDTKLDLNNISCGGESAESMINGSQLPSVRSSCGPPEFYQSHFPHKTQLAEAVNFLHAHKERVDLVTITIGANDLAPCTGTRDFACYEVVLPSMAQDLDQVLDTPQATAPNVRIVGMTYHNPTACLLPIDPGSAGFLQQVVLALNATLLAVYEEHGVAVADVAGAFSVSDLTASAQAAAAWTWFCHPDHFGNLHPNDAGYAVIANAFLDVT